MTGLDATMVTEEDMYKAQLTFIGILSANYEKLPVLRTGSNSFCVFCFTFHSSPNHECISLAISNEAEKIAGIWLCQLVGNAGKVDRALMEKLKESVFTRIEEYEKQKNYLKAVSNPNKTGSFPQKSNKRSRPMKTKHSPKQQKIGNSMQTTDSSSITNRSVHTQIETSTSSSDSYSLSHEAEDSQSSADSPVYESLDVGQIFSSTGRLLRKTTRYETVTRSLIKTNKKISIANILADYEEFCVHVAPALPADQQTWTRQHYQKSYYEKHQASQQSSGSFN